MMKVGNAASNLFRSVIELLSGKRGSITGSVGNRRYHPGAEKANRPPLPIFSILSFRSLAEPMNRSSIIGAETRAMFALALPVVADQVGMMSMSFVDTIMVGRLGGEALGAVGIGSAVTFFYMVFAYGVISSVSPVVAQAFGAGDREEIARTVGQAFWLGVTLAAGGIVLAWNIGAVLVALKQPAELIAPAERFTRALSFGMPATILYASLRAFTVGLGRTRVTMMISMGASALNAGLNYVLIYGKLGMPALGVMGAGLATSIVQWSMLSMMLLYTVRSRDLRPYPFLRYVLPLDRGRLLRLIKLGAPIGAGNSMEVGIFGLTALFMGQIGKLPLAAHQVAINVASLIFMVPLGISTATATRVGQAVGRKDPEGAALSGWVGIGLATAVMIFSATLLLAIPEAIVSIYTAEAAVISYAVPLLMIAGAFQIFDGIQVAALGALRGLKDTALPMLVNLLAYWLVGVPTGYLLAFTADVGGPGLWWGLTSGLAVAAVLHTLRFRMIVRSIPA
jgi:multidrug resistance protein, MATE family